MNDPRAITATSSFTYDPDRGWWTPRSKPKKARDPVWEAVMRRKLASKPGKPR